MIKINVEYTIIKDKIVNITSIINKDPSSTLMEKMLAQSVKVLIDDQLEKIVEPNNIDNILNDIGKT